LQVDSQHVKEAELKDMRERASQYSIDGLGLNELEPLFRRLQSAVLGLSEDITELCGAKSVTYRVYNFFLEVIPRKYQLALLLNLDFEECDDPTQRVVDTSEYAFIPNASEKGGVLLCLDNDEQIPAASHVIRQAFEKVSE
jgi:predicted transport protein